jgi:hypothetical protein
MLVRTMFRNVLPPTSALLLVSSETGVLHEATHRCVSKELNVAASRCVGSGPDAKSPASCWARAVETVAVPSEVHEPSLPEEESVEYEPE